MNDSYEKKADSVYSKRLKAGKRRTYFFDVRATRGNDYFLTITESRKRQTDDGYDRHKIFLYKEDFNKFLRGLNEAVDFVKTELMPDFDFDSFNHDTTEGESNTAKSEMDNHTQNSLTGREINAVETAHNTIARKDIIDGTPREGFEGTNTVLEKEESTFKVNEKPLNNATHSEDTDRW